MIDSDDAWRYTPHTFATHASQGRWKCSRHLAYIGTRIAQTIGAGDGRLIINCPPRHGKSFLVSYWLPIWFLDNWPSKRVILAAYGDEIAMEWGRRVRNELASNDWLRTKLRDDSKAAGRWHTPDGGGMLVAGAGGPLSGFGGDLLIADDLIKNWQEAHSSQSKTVLRDWWKSTFFTRKEPHASVILALTRWADDDICAWLQKEQPGVWTVIRLPALAEDNDPLGRAPNTPLYPDRFSLDAMMQERRDVGTDVWAALYQQAPEMSTNRLYSHFSIANEDATIQPRHHLPLCVTWDFNISPGNHVEMFQYDPAADMFYVFEEFHGPRMDVQGACECIRKWIAARGWVPGGQAGALPWKELHIFGDASGGGQWAGTGDSCYDIMQRALSKVPHRMRRPASNPPVIDRINTVNEALRDVEGKIHVKIHPRCVRLIDDLRSMKPDPQGLEDKRDSKLSHASSALGYAIVYLRPLWRNGPARVGGRYGN